MTPCAEYRKNLNAYLDEELSEPERISMELHLSRCASCRAALEALRKLEPILHTLEVPSMPENLTTRIMTEAYGRKRTAGIRPIPSATGRWRLKSWLIERATAAALVAGLMLGAYMGWTSFEGSGSALPAPGSMTDEQGNFWYALDALGAAPQGSIEAATLALLDDRALLDDGE